MEASNSPAAVNLLEAVAYAADSVVSKTLLQNEGGNITLFAFDKGQGLSEHTTPFSALVHTLEGTASWTIGGSLVKVGAGEAVTLPASVPHAVTAETPFKMALIMLRG